MIGIYVSPKGFISWAIKIFTYWYLKEFKERHLEYEWMKIKDIPTHSLIGWDMGLEGEKIIFESSKTQQLHPYYKCKYEFEFQDGNDVKLFWEMVHESIGDWYGVFQLYYFIKISVWMTLFKWLVPLWSEIFHGGKPILLWGNPFVWFRICTETCYEYLQKKTKKEKLPETERQLSRVNRNNVFPLLLLDMCLSISDKKEMKQNPNY